MVKVSRFYGRFEEKKVSLEGLIKKMNRESREALESN